jgi:acetyl-CoA acetyltransferase
MEAWISGVARTPFGRREGLGTLDLMSEAATAALDDAQLRREDIDGLISGYSTVLPHLMLATVFAEHFGLSPRYAHAIQLGGATGYAMAMLANTIVRAGEARHVLVVAGENRLSGQTRDSAIQALAQVGHPLHETPLGATVPAYYGLIASAYMERYSVLPEDLAELAVLMRSNAAGTPGAHLSDLLSVADVLASRPIAEPLRLLDCCPVSDGAAAFVVSSDAHSRARIRILGGGQAHTHQHISEAPSLTGFGAAASGARAEAASGARARDAEYAAIYDSFTITLAILLEEIGLAGRGEAGPSARDGYFSPHGVLPLNTHGGLLSYGHCGVAGAMAHLVEAVWQMSEAAGERQVRPPGLALLHGDGGVMSSHVSLFLERTR